MKNRLSRLATTTLLLMAAAVPSHSVWAAVSAAEAAKLKNELTPVGAERAGNKEGTIPAWTGGFSPLVPQVGGRRTNPFPQDKPLFSITAQNLDKHADKLAPGVVAMFKKNPTTFRIDVYPTRRTAAQPRESYEATAKSAVSTKVTRQPNGQFLIEGDAGGVPFPIPQSGEEVIYNVLMGIYNPQMRATASNYLIQPDGRRVLISTFDNLFAYQHAGPERLNNGRLLSVRSVTTNPPLRAGEQVVGHFFADQSKNASWVYLPGQRRVRKLPNSCCDTPTPFSAGLYSFDEIAVWGGNPYKFDWKIAGKKEMYIPYNSNITWVPKTADEVIVKSHLNPDHVRWELHRVWVLEAKLREGERHISPRSTYYVDEDTWGPAAMERYDAENRLAKVSYILPILLTETSTQWSATQAYHDMVSGASYIAVLFNEIPEQITVTPIRQVDVSPDAMSGESAR